MADHYLTQNKSAGSGLRIRLPTFNGVEVYAYNDEAQTHNNGEEGGKNNGQAPVPIPHSPCP